MSDIKLIQILRTFSNEEFAQFKKFTSSPYFNEGRNFIPIINVLKKYHPEFDKNEFSREKVFDELYPGEIYKPALLDKLFSRTALLAENFLIIEANKENRIRNISQLAKQYSNRNLAKLFNVKISEAEKLLEKESLHSLYYFEYAKELEISKIDFIFANKDSYTTPKDLTLRGELNLLDFMVKYIHSQMDIYIEGIELNRDLSSSAVTKSAEFIDIDGIINIFEEKKSRYTVALKLKYYEYLALKIADLKHYSQFQELVVKNINSMPWSEKFNKMLNLLSTCNMMIRKRKDDYYAVQFELAKFIVDQGVYAINKDTNTYLPLYLSLLGILQRNKELVYIEKLINTFGSKIEHNSQKSYIAHSKICKYIAEKNYSEAQKYLNNVDYGHSLIKINARINAIIIYYELNYTEELLSLIDASIKFLNSVDYQAADKIEGVINFVKAVKKLVRLKQADDKENLFQFKQEILKLQNIFMKNWLIKKIDIYDN